jgi:hypothetical protein
MAKKLVSETPDFMAPGHSLLPAAAVHKKAREAMAAINKGSKYKLVDYAENVSNPYTLRRPCGIMPLDVDTGGGLPAGGICYISGPDGCLAGDTFIQYEVRNDSRPGYRQNHKGGTLLNLYNRFHQIPADGKGMHTRPIPDGAAFYAPSINDDGGVFQNRIADVVSCGEKECFELLTQGGQRIVATEEHKFFVGDRYLPLSQLHVGDTVYVHLSTPKKGRARRVRRATVHVKNHPNGGVHVIDDTYTYKRLQKSHIVVEAYMNDLSFDAYVDRLNSGALEGLRFLPRNMEVHHLDENCRNDVIENLLVIDPLVHGRLHALKDHNRLRYVATEDTVVQIRSVGSMPTYDIKMEAPYNNYVANNIVVHNSGKTYLLNNYFAMHQRIYGESASILYAPVEFLPDYVHMSKVGCAVALPDQMIAEINRDRLFRRMPLLTKEETTALKRQVGVFAILRTQTAEEMLDSLLRAYASNAFHIIAVDSISVLQAKVEAALDTLEDNPQQAANASLLTRFMQRFHPLTLGLSDELVTTTTIFTAQVRSNRKKSEVPSYMSKYMKDWATTGGANAMKHGKLIDIQIWSDGKEKEGKDKEVVGKTMRWDLVKGKAGTHDNITGEYVYRYKEPGEHTRSIIESGVSHGVCVEVDGGLTFLHAQTKEPLILSNGMTLQGIPGVGGLKEIFNQSLEAELMVRREILAAAGVERCLYT